VTADRTAAGDNGILEASFLDVFFDFVSVVTETEGVDRAEVGVEFLETVLVDEEVDALIGGEKVIVVALGADP
jgi:hypothetical protein